MAVEEYLLGNFLRDRSGKLNSTLARLAIATWIRHEKVLEKADSTMASVTLIIAGNNFPDFCAKEFPKEFPGIEQKIISDAAISAESAGWLKEAAAKYVEKVMEKK